MPLADIMKQVLAHGSQVEVMAPEWLKEEIANMRTVYE
jgi:predicted DNA-binding transcriptional regulator YafY